MKKPQQIRIEAANAAAIAFSSGSFTTIEELWSLSVFFEKFIARGGKATLKEFGPKPETADVVQLVGKP